MQVYNKNGTFSSIHWKSQDLPVESFSPDWNIAVGGRTLVGITTSDNSNCRGEEHRCYEYKKETSSWIRILGSMFAKVLVACQVENQVIVTRGNNYKTVSLLKLKEAVHGSSVSIVECKTNLPNVVTDQYLWVFLNGAIQSSDLDCSIRCDSNDS